MEPKAIRPKPAEMGNREILRPPKKPLAKRTYHCGTCLMEFPRHLAAKRHEQECQAKLRRLFICRHCLTLYGDESRLQRHQERKHKGNDQFLCLQCGKKYSSATFLYRHVVTWHGEQSLFYCAMCADNCNDVKSFSDMQQLQEHAEEVHHLRSLESTTSETESLIDETEDLEMLEENIEDMLPNVDWGDDLTFNWPMDLDKELSVVDAKPSVFVCPFCANGFSGSLSLVNHLKESHHKNTLECCYCGRNHGSREALRSHLQRVHILLRAHVCDVCQADFATADHLKKHVNSKHLNHRPHVCPTCGSTFAQRSHLNQHMKTERRHEQFTCQLCQWPFFRAIDLERHVNEKHP